MTEAQVGFLYNIAGILSLSKSDDNPTKTLLQSYYLMRCKEITGGHKLPNKHFSLEARCQKCCIEWHSNTEVKIRPIKLTKTQRQGQISQKANQNEIVQICTFCKNSRTTTASKPKKEKVKTVTRINNDNNNIKDITRVHVNPVQKKEQPKTKNANIKKKTEINVYSNAFDVFSLKNKNNTLANTVKELPKVINNNKKKKDKFAGLCQKAVLASAKIKEEKSKQNKLNLFLKPST